MNVGRILLVSLSLVACRKTEVVRPDESKSAPRVVCNVPQGHVATRVEVPARCDVAVSGTLSVGAGGLLILAPGAKLSFAKGARLEISGGALVARGTTEEPVVLTAREGEWGGLRFFTASAAPGDAATKGEAGHSTLEHVVVEHVQAGEKGAAVDMASLGEDRLSLSWVTFRKNRPVALRVEHASNLAPAESLRFEGNARALDVDVDVLALLDVRAVAEPVALRGRVTRSVTLPKNTYDVVGALHVAPSEPATLTIEPGAVLRFDAGTRLVAAGLGAATLIAKQATFTSSSGKPDWMGLQLGSDATVRIEECVFEHVGGTSGVLNLPSDESKVVVTGTRFRSNVVPAFYTSNACARWEDPAKKNVSTGAALCARSNAAKAKEIAAALDALEMKAIGTLGGDSVSTSVLKEAPSGAIDQAATSSSSGLKTGSGGGGLGGAKP